MILLTLALAADPLPSPTEQCASGDLLGCLTALGDASRARAWADEPVPTVRRYDVEAYAARACLLGELGLCGFAEQAPERLWRHLPKGHVWLPGDPVALPGGGWTRRLDAALGFTGHTVDGDVVGTGSGLLVLSDGAVVLHDVDGAQPVTIPGKPTVCRLEARQDVVRVGFLDGERCDRGAMVLRLDTGKEADVPPERGRPQQATMDDGSILELTDGSLVQRSDAGETIRSWPLDTSLPQHLLPHPDGLSVAVVSATGSLIVPLVEGFGTIQPVPEWFERADPGDPSRIEIEVPGWARTVCELSTTFHDRPMRNGDVLRVDPTTISLPDHARGMTLLASSDPSGCTDGTPQDAARWPPTAEKLALLTPSAEAFREVERRVITIEDEDGQPAVGLPIEVKGRLPYKTETDLDGTFLWWNEGGSELVVGSGIDMPTMKADRWELPASGKIPGGKPADPLTLTGVWKPQSQLSMPWVFLTPDDIGRGWALVSPTRFVHIASTRRETRVVQCRGCVKPTRYEPLDATASLGAKSFTGGSPPSGPTPYTSRIERPNLHRALPKDIAARLEDVGATDPTRLVQPGGPLLTALSGRTFEEGERTDVVLVAHGTTYAATVRYEGKEDCGAGKNACASLVMEIHGGFERWVVEPNPLRVHRIERRDDGGEVVEILDVTWE